MLRITFAFIKTIIRLYALFKLAAFRNEALIVLRILLLYLSENTSVKWIALADSIGHYLIMELERKQPDSITKTHL